MTNGFTRERKIERWGETEEKLSRMGFLDWRKDFLNSLISIQIYAYFKYSVL